MPVYEYRCPACDQRFDKLIAASSRDDEAQCPACGYEQGRRLISTFAAFSTNGGQTAALGGCCGGGGACACGHA